MAAEYVEPGRRNWGREECWGMFAIPERDLHLLPDVEGMTTVELGCGTGYVSAWLARRGASPIGIDPTSAQIGSARTFQQEFDLAFPLVQAAGEQVPLPDRCCDLVISEYGAALWSDPHLWIPEAARILRPGGQLIFLTNSVLLTLCVNETDAEGPADNVLKRSAFDMHRVEWSDDPGVEFHLSHGDWVRLLRSHGFVVEDLVELRPAEDATTRYPFVTTAWARRWPVEEAWRARKAPATP
jgi:SAM-dependent methyltransferase